MKSPAIYSDGTWQSPESGTSTHILRIARGIATEKDNKDKGYLFATESTESTEKCKKRLKNKRLILFFFPSFLLLFFYLFSVFFRGFRGEKYPFISLGVLAVMFIISKLAIALISPLGSALFGGLLALILGFAGRRRLALGLGVLSLAWLWAWSLPVASYAIRGYLENQHPAVNASALPEAGAIVVLGGGTSPLSYGEPYPNLGSASDRGWHGARLYHAGKAPLLILTGGHDPRYRATSSAEAMRRFISALGVPESALLMEERSRNTTQNAEFTADILARRGIDRILLVTSALHMPRSRALFEAQGLEVIPAATDHEVRTLPAWRAWLPDSDALDGSSRAIKEIVGRLVGR